MNYRNNDCGAVQYGNFINYYQFNSAEARLQLLPQEKHIWCTDGTVANNTAEEKEYLVLDVGCNSGVFTELLWTHLSTTTNREVHILAVDIDPTLIQRAEKNNQHKEYIHFQSLDVMDPDAYEHIRAFLQKFQRLTFDSVCCFSVTMWLHLNHHDSGLQEFLRKYAELAKTFVVEPQPWKCYQTAERRLKKNGEVFPLFRQLQWRSQVERNIQTYLETRLGRRKIFECPPTKWNRRICFYR